MVILNRKDHNKGILDIVNDADKLQRFLWELKKKGRIDKDIHNRIYATSSQPAGIYGLPKLHKVMSPVVVPPFRPMFPSLIHMIIT